jgi:hypothetical protein
MDGVRPVLLSSFNPPFTLQELNFPSELSPLDIVWSSNKTMPSSSLLTFYNATVSYLYLNSIGFSSAYTLTTNNNLSYYCQKSTISLWEVELSSMARLENDVPDGGEATPAQKRAYVLYVDYIQ